MNRCGACGLEFGSVRAFSAHRVGVHAYTHSEGLKMSPPRADGRRCLAEGMLEDAGFARNARREWSLAHDLLRARKLNAAKHRTSDEASK